MSEETALPTAEAPAAPPFQMRGVGRQTLIYGLGIVLAKVASFVMLPIYTRFLTPADYGTIQLIEMTLDVISIIAGVQLAAGIFRYYHKASDEAERNTVVSTALLLLSATYVTVGLVTFLCAVPLSHLVFGGPENASLIRLAAASVSLSSLLITPLAYVRAKNRPGVFVTANAVKLVLQVGLTVLFLVVMGMGPAGVFLATLIANALVGGSLGIYLVRAVGISFSWPITRSLLRYGLPLIATQFATFAATFGDRYFLQAAADTTVVGLYALAYQFGFLLASIGYIPLQMVWEPIRFEVAKRPDRDDVYARVFIYLNIVLLTMAVGITLFVGDLLRVMAAPAFHPAAAIVPIILVAYVLQCWASFQETGILVRERTEYIMTANWIGAGVALIGFAVLVPLFLGWGAAVAAVLAFSVRYGLIYYFSQKLWRIEYQWRPVLKLAALSAAIGLGGLLLPDLTLLPSVAVRSLLFFVYLGLVWHSGVISKEERSMVVATCVQAISALRSHAPALRNRGN